MGLLDDAIREHLELKRRRGADPVEIERETHEALGPVRREAAAAPSPEPDDHTVGLEDPAEAYAEPAVVEDPRDRLHVEEEPLTHDAPYAERESESATPPHGDPYQPTREFSPTELEEALGDASPEREDAGAERPRDAPEAEAAGEGEGRDERDEDVLEETPDFLQETPEHDRLWFEQKPPKDFDF